MTCSQVFKFIQEENNWNKMFFWGIKIKKIEIVYIINNYQ